MGTKIAGPGRLGSIKAVKKSLKKSGNANVKNIPKEDSLTVRFLDEPEDWHGYYEHWIDKIPRPCVEDDCEGCNSDDPDERKKVFRYLANAYVVDDQKVQVLKLPKSIVESLVAFYTKYEGTIMDRDYELSRTGSGQNDTRYMAIPESPTKLKLSRFKDKMFDLDEVLQSMVESDDDDDDDDDDDEPVRSKSKKSKSGKKKSKPDPWEDDDEEDDEPVVRKKKSSASVKKKTVAKKRSVKRK